MPTTRFRIYIVTLFFILFGATVTVTNNAYAGFTLGTTCESYTIEEYGENVKDSCGNAAGCYWNDEAGECTVCTEGYYCPGGGAEPRIKCNPGFSTYEQKGEEQEGEEQEVKEQGGATEEADCKKICNTIKTTVGTWVPTPKQVSQTAPDTTCQYIMDIGSTFICDDKYFFMKTDMDGACVPVNDAETDTYYTKLATDDSSEIKERIATCCIKDLTCTKENMERAEILSMNNINLENSLNPNIRIYMSQSELEEDTNPNTNPNTKAYFFTRIDNESIISAISNSVDSTSMMHYNGNGNWTNNCKLISKPTISMELSSFRQLKLDEYTSTPVAIGTFELTEPNDGDPKWNLTLKAMGKCESGSCKEGKLCVQIPDGEYRDSDSVCTKCPNFTTSKSYLHPDTDTNISGAQHCYYPSNLTFTDSKNNTFTLDDLIGAGKTIRYKSQN